MENEEWKDIQDFNGYKCSNLGRIMSFKNDSCGKLLAIKPNAYGYPSVTMKGNDNKAYRPPVHRIVAILFVDNPNNHTKVNHKNGIKIDNTASNLEWCTTAENTQHYHDTIKSKRTKSESVEVSYFDDSRIDFTVAEEWRTINKFPMYMCSNRGRIRSHYKSNDGIMLAPRCTNAGGYIRLYMTDENGKHSSQFVHILVAQTFMQNPHSYPIVNHINGIKTDNRVENLEWCSTSYNNTHAYTYLGRLGNIGENNGNAKITEEQAKSIISLMEKNELTQIQISNQTGISIPTIKQIKAGKNWKHLSNNIADKRYSKLSKEKIIEIYELSWKSDLVQQEIADKYNISSDTVHNIKCGIEWSEITGQVYEKNIHTSSELSEETVMKIYNDSWNSDLTEKEIGDKYNTSSATVNRIKNGRVWANVTGHKENAEKLPIHLCTTLSKENVLDIYDLSWNSTLSQREIGKKYNIKQSTVNDIKTGRTWSKVTGHNKNNRQEGS